MKQASVFRVTGEICFWFAVLHLFAAFRQWELPLAAFALFCFALGFLIVLCRSAALRLLLSLLPGLCFLPVGPQPLLLFPAMGWVYYVIVMTRGRFGLRLDEFRRSYRWLLVLCLALGAAYFVDGAIFDGQHISWESQVYAVLYLAFGAYALRRMAMGSDISRGWHVSNALSMAGFPALAVGGSVLLLLFWSKALGPALLFLLKTVTRALARLLGMFLSVRPVEDVEPTVEPSPSPTPTDPPEEVAYWTSVSEKDTMQALDVDADLVEKLARIGAWVLLGLLLLLVFWLLLRRARRAQALREEENDPYSLETENAAPREGLFRRRSAQNAGNAGELRKIYQSYLKYENSLGVHILRAYTSGEVLTKAQMLREEPQAVRLRELYIAARYGDPAAVTREQVEEARTCLEEIKRIRQS